MVESGSLQLMSLHVSDNVKSVAVVSGLLATEREAITKINTNTKQPTDNIQPRITATQC